MVRSRLAVTSWAVQGGMHLFRMAERNQLGRAAPKGDTCENPTRGKGKKSGGGKAREGSNPSRSKYLLSQLPLSDPPRRSLKRRTGSTLLSKQRSVASVVKAKSPVKAANSRHLRRTRFFDKLVARIAPKDWRSKCYIWSVKSRFVTDTMHSFSEDNCGGGTYFKPCDGGRSGSRCSETVREIRDVTRGSLIPKRWKALVRRTRRLFRKFRGGSFLLLCPNWGSRPPRKDTVGKIAEQLGKRPNRRARRFLLNGRTHNEPVKVGR